MRKFMVCAIHQVILDQIREKEVGGEVECMGEKPNA